MPNGKGPTGSSEPLPTCSTELRRPRRLRPLGRVRLPLAGPYRPWATLYRFPDGRTLWLVRLWEVDRPVPRLVPTWVLRAFAERNGLPAFRAEVDALVDRVGGEHGPDGPSN